MVCGKGKQARRLRLEQLESRRLLTGVELQIVQVPSAVPAGDCHDFPYIRGGELQPITQLICSFNAAPTINATLVPQGEPPAQTRVEFSAGAALSGSGAVAGFDGPLTIKIVNRPAGTSTHLKVDWTGHIDSNVVSRFGEPDTLINIAAPAVFLHDEFSPPSGPASQTFNGEKVFETLDDTFTISLFGYAASEGYVTGTSGFQLEVNIQELPDIENVAISYLPGDTVADDKIHVTYALAGLPSGQNVNARLYWSQDGNYSVGLVPASPLLAAPASGTLDVKVSTISKQPNSATKYLVVHVDDNGQKKEGDVLEVSENNNAASLDVTPDISVDELTWNTFQGGLDVDYSVKNRGFVKDNIPVDVYWDKDTPATSKSFTTPPGGVHMYVAAQDFLPPTKQNSSVTVVFDKLVGDDGKPNASGKIVETNEDNQLAKDMPDLAPKVTVTVTGDTSKNGDPQRKKNYGVWVAITNVAPFPVYALINWREVSDPSLVRDTNSTSDRYDAMTGKPADRSFVPSLLEPILLPFGAAPVKKGLESLDGLGSFNRTWNWLPASYEVTSKQLLDNDPPDAVSDILKVGQKLLDVLGSPLRKSAVN
jgi:hypothetical protein